MILSVHQPQYIPWLGYFDKIDKSDIFVFLDKVQYKPREYQNRNRICTKTGYIWLSVPVISKGLGRQEIRAVRIDNGLNWQNKHWESIKRSYNRTPFFKEYSDFFQAVYSKKWDKLIDLNIHIIDYLIKEFKIKTPLYYESEVGTSLQATDRIIELCQKLRADTYLSGVGGKDYLEEDKFTKAGIQLMYQEFSHPRYRQQYMRENNSFLPYMSVLDLLFNEGKKSMDILRGKF